MAGGAIASADRPGYDHLINRTVPWYKNSRILLLNFWICLLLLTSSTNGYDGSMMNGLQVLDQWNRYFNFPNSSQLGLLNAIQNIGSLAAFPFAPYLSDGLGRKPSIFIGAVIMCGATALQAASQSVGMFIGSRFMIGFGVMLAHSAAPLLVTEIAYPSQRAQLTSLYNTLWYLGSIIAAWVTFGTFRIPSTWAWRIPSALQALPSVIQILLIYFVPESPRWLISKGRDEQALNTLAYYHANGDSSDPLVKYEFEEIKTAISIDREISQNVGWLSLIKTPGNRRRMRIIIAIAFFSQWSGNGLVSYYLNLVFTAIGIEDKNTQLLLNGILNIFNFIVAIIAGFLCEKVGRRKLFMLSTTGMLFFWSLETACFAAYKQYHNAAAGKAVVAWIFLYYAAYDLAFTPLIVSYTVEILPYPLRAKGFVIFNFAISLSLIFNQYVNPTAMNKLDWKYFLVYVVWLAVEVVFCYFFIVETKNRSLEETAALFDGDEAMDMIHEKGLERAAGVPEGLTKRSTSGEEFGAVEK
ncbi:hypothetical protein CVT24_006431 [Panaeolus cyanescens]|uniref:Major facilitator superfamily (MFS) profile domain-containing protein n=1 Tax=Panaeolus cyanescens TaxID=181874 RepID=A0A409VZ83_9AGAR|nr:hypothetical protein CVT24_006431 [Panaeolus cyanescens]